MGSSDEDQRRGGRILLEADTPFSRDLREEAKGYFEQAGFRPSAKPTTYAKAAVLALTLVASYSAFLSWRPLPWCALVVLAIVGGIATTGIIFNVHHDGGHGAWSERRWVNRVMAASFDAVGMSSFLWRWKHNRFHHTYPNIESFDDDIDVLPFARLAPGQPMCWYHRFQHIYIWMLYPLLTIKWGLFDDLYEVATGRIGQQRIRRPRGGNLALFSSGKVFFLTWMFLFPFLVHGGVVVLVYYLLSQFTVGFCTALVFQLAHVVEEVGRARAPGPGVTERLDWGIHQVCSTVEFARQSRWATWFLGGLNHQVVHHLFPGVSHVHYPALSSVVQRVCLRHGVAYSADHSAQELVRSHFRWLRRMGRGN